MSDKLTEIRSRREALRKTRRAIRHTDRAFLIAAMHQRSPLIAPLFEAWVCLRLLRLIREEKEKRAASAHQFKN